MNKRILLLIVILILTIALIWSWIRKLESQGPKISHDIKVKYLNKPQTLNFHIEDLGSGLRSIHIAIVQRDSQNEIYSEELPGSLLWNRKNTIRKTIQIPFDPAAMKVKEGPLTFVVTARDYSWRNKLTGNTTIEEQSFTLDRIPPNLVCLSTQHYLNQGGTGFAVYQTSEDSIKDGVQVGDAFYPGFAVKTESNPLAHVVYFALPYDQPDPRIELISADEAGNEARVSFYYLLKKKAFRQDSLTISDDFLKKKIPQFYAMDNTLPGMSLTDAFLRINNYWRDQSHRQLREICQKSQPECLWKGKFLRLPNAEPSALYADHRIYIYNGSKIDEQTHLGLDLASLAHSPVPAANSGLVIYQGDLGIYGKTIILDHGQNVFSMYSHLSNFSVTAGQKVTIGQTIGITGDTGWAGGDHLHLSMMIGGTFVNPIEWWDEHWIKDNIELKLGILSPPPAPAAAPAAATGGKKRHWLM
ncbi:MAG: M23 family metallopeptidase [bacterium]